MRPFLFKPPQKASWNPFSYGFKHPWAGAMAQSVKWSPCKHENLNPTPRPYIQRTGYGSSFLLSQSRGGKQADISLTPGKGKLRPVSNSVSKNKTNSPNKTGG